MDNFRLGSVNELGHLVFGGIDTCDIVDEFGTPVYVMDQNIIENNCRSFKDMLDKYYDGKGKVFYASKALSCLEICRIMKHEGLGLDVVSGGELYTALKAGFDPQNILFHGNNKTQDEIIMAIKNKVGRIIVDNIFELEVIDSLARRAGSYVDIGLRIKPGIKVNTHKFITTGHTESKFGFSISNGEAVEAIKFAKALQNVKLCQLHCHIGSQIQDYSVYLKTVERMMSFMNDVHRDFFIKFQELNLGGGFGIQYTDNDVPLDYEKCMREVCQLVKVRSAQYRMDPPYLFIEPGRSIVGNAGITLYKIGAIKELSGFNTFISIDGGMSDNPRHIIYNSDYSVLIANKMNNIKSLVVTVAGKCCENGDLIAENVSVPNPEIGDIVAVECTGAYNYSMASNYNRLRRPPIVMIKDKKPRIIVRRESYDDILKNDL